MAKKNTDKIGPSAKPRAPRRTKPAADPVVPADVAAGVTSTGQRTEAHDRAVSPAASDTPAEGIVSSDPSYDDIARAAYDRFLSRGGHHGRDFDDWVEAERDLRSRR